MVVYREVENNRNDPEHWIIESNVMNIEIQGRVRGSNDDDVDDMGTTTTTEAS